MNSIKRSLVKTISWRAIGTIDTMVITYIVTGNLKFGLAVADLSSLVKQLNVF